MKHKSRLACGLSPLILAASLASTMPAFSAIVFANADLEGTLAAATVPTDWEKVPFDASFSEATTDGASNGDVVGPTGPNVAGGIFGSAHSGSSFVAGAHSTVATVVLQEGIQQIVTGFTVGGTYSFSFFQATVSTSNAADNAGSWRVYADGALIATTLPTATTLAYNDAAKATSLVWEERTVTFTATAESLTLSFLAYDTDGDISPGNGVYMGLDSLSEITAVPEPASILLGALGLLGLMRRRR